jgi:hypothetical protein
MRSKMDTAQVQLMDFLGTLSRHINSSVLDTNASNPTRWRGPVLRRISCSEPACPGLPARDIQMCDNPLVPSKLSAIRHRCQCRANCITSRPDLAPDGNPVF